MANLTLPAPNGWNEWDLARNVMGPDIVPDIPFAPLYTPSDAFWIRALADHCQINWLIPYDYFTVFLLAGGSSGTLIGSLGGLATANFLQDLPGILDYGIGRDGVGPQLGYTINDLFKQQAYVRLFSVSLVPGGVSSTKADIEHYVELLQNSRYRLLYLKEGQVFGSSVQDDKMVLDLGVEKNYDANTTFNFQIEITTQGGSVITSPCSFLANWNVKLDTPLTTPNVTNIAAGDFFKISSSPFCLEDPFLMSGFWQGPENANPPPGSTSGYNLYRTTHNAPYKKGEFTGFYYLKDTQTGDIKNFAVGAPLRDIGDSRWHFLGFGNSDDQSDYYNDDTRYIEVIEFGQSSTATSATVADAADGMTVSYEPMPNGTSVDYATITGADPEPEFIRVEIGHGAATNAHNWYAPCLEGQYLKVGGTYFKILSHPQAMILDVSFRNIDGTKKFEPVAIGSAPGSGGQSTPSFAVEPYSLTNMKAWVLAEHYDGDPGTAESFTTTNQLGALGAASTSLISDKHNGVFKGRIAEIKTFPPAANLSPGQLPTTYIIVNTIGDSFVSLHEFRGYNAPDIDNNFASRYKQTHDHNATPNEPDAYYRKYNRWKLVVDQGDEEFFIKTVQFPSTFNSSLYQNAFYPSPQPQDLFGSSYVFPQSSNEPYPIAVEVDAQDLTGLIDKESYITFDDGFDTVPPFGRENGYEYFMTARPSIGESDEANPFLNFINYNKICIDAEFFAAPYDLDVPLYARLGCCEGYLYGVDFDGTAASRIGMWVLMSTPRQARGTASLFHAIREEDWVVFSDQETNKLNIRRGCLDFKEMPRKTEVAIGYPVWEEYGTTTFNPDYQRVNRVLISVPSLQSNADPSAIMVALNRIDNIYGFLISGDGIVDLQMLRLQGVDAGDLQSNAYTNLGGDFISPVYVYKKDTNYQFLNKLSIDIGASTEDYSNVVFFEQTVPGDSSTSATVNISDVTIEYVDDKQTIDDPSLFDVMKIADGEVYLIYGQKVTDFFLLNPDTTTEPIKKPNNGASYTYNDPLNTDADPDTGDVTLETAPWSNLSCIFMIGSQNDSDYWGAPAVAKSGLDAVPFPVMILNAVEYLASFYDPMTQKVNIFARCFENKEPYIGLFVMATDSLTHTLYECVDALATSPAEEDLKFYWRPPLLKDTFLNDENKSYTDNDNLVDDYFAFAGAAGTGLTPDEFVRIMGSPATDSKIEFAGEFGVVSATMLEDGSYVLFFDSEIGIRAAFSTNKGRTWFESGLTYSRTGRAGVIIGRYFFYVTEDGIEMKWTGRGDLFDDKNIGQRKLAGENVGVLEVEKQEQLDDMKSYLIGSGPIPFQRLSGYVTNDGTTKIFFYDNNNKLKCMESNDGISWRVADNF